MKISVLADHTIYIDAVSEALMNEKKYRKKQIIELIDLVKSMLQTNVYAVAVKKKLIIFSNDEMI